MQHIPEDITRSATSKWLGDVAKGHGTLGTGSGTVTATYSFGTRFAAEPGTNPEELLAAALASCFTMALDASLTRAGHPPKSLDVTAKVHLTRDGGTFDIARMELFLSATIAGITDNEFQQLAMHAKETCPVGRSFRGMPISLVATLHTTV